MKKVLMICLLTFPFLCYAQIKGDNKIVIKNNLTAKENYALINKTLLNNDYYIDSKDSSNYYIKTQPKAVNKWTGSYF